MLAASAEAHKLRVAPSFFRPVPMAHQSHISPFVSPALQTATRMFLQKDALRKSLQLLYDGSYLVLDRAQKFFTIYIHGLE